MKRDMRHTPATSWLRLLGIGLLAYGMVEVFLLCCRAYDGSWPIAAYGIGGIGSLGAVIGAVLLLAKPLGKREGAKQTLLGKTLFSPRRGLWAAASFLLPFRKEISFRLKVALGTVSVLTLVAGYTVLSEYWRVAYPNSRAIPTWHMMYTEGLVKAFTEGLQDTAREDESENAEAGAGPDEPSYGRIKDYAKAPFLFAKELFFGDRYDVWIWEDTKATFTRLFVGMLVGAAVSVGVGLLMGCYPTIEAFFLPALSFLAKIPPTAAITVFFVILATGFEMYVGMIAFGMIPTLAQAIYHSAKEDVPEELIFKSYTLGATQAKCIWDVIFKHVLPKILEFVRLQVGPSMVYLIAAEYVVGHVGFGYRIRLQMRLLNMSLVFVYLAFLGTAGFLIDCAFIRFQRWLCPWYGR